MAVAALMIAHQVAGKALRDSLFLSTHAISDLPTIMMAAAGLSVLIVLMFARLLGRFGPFRIVPAGFLLSALAHITEYMFLQRSPALWSSVVYLHIVAQSPILLSGFWSQMSEAFDPRAAKQVFGRIATVGTLGGIAGGLMAERIAALVSANAVLPLLAALHLSCALILASTGRVSPTPAHSRQVEAFSPVALFRRAPYLSLIALMVLAGTSSAAIIDFLFKHSAVDLYGKGSEALARFFARFYTSTQILTLLVQTLMVRRALNRLGISRTISALPAGVGAGALSALLVPNLLQVFFGIRSLELILRGSFYRAAYELVYTPVPAAEKRSAKTLIDVAVDRAGDALGGGVVQLLLWLSPSLNSGLLGIVLALAAAGIWISMRLDAAYSGLVRQRLVDRAVEFDLRDIRDSTTRSAVVRTPAPLPADLATTSDSGPTPAWRDDPTLAAIRELRSGDKRRVLVALLKTAQPTPVLAAQLVRLLAWDEVSDAVRETLLLNPGPITGLLVDHLTNPDVGFDIRRQIPRILARCDSQLAVHGLIAGLADARFEVRFRCSRALDALVQHRPDLKIPADAIFATVERELQVAHPIWDSRRLLDKHDGSDPDAFLDQILRERANRSLEHIFSLFATVLPREPVKVAFRALHTDDKALRGLAAEYLDSVLPANIRERLWAMVEPRLAAKSQTPVSGHDALAKLLQSHESLMILIDKAGGPGQKKGSK